LVVVWTDGGMATEYAKFVCQAKFRHWARAWAGATAAGVSVYFGAAAASPTRPIRQRLPTFEATVLKRTVKSQTSGEASAGVKKKRPAHRQSEFAGDPLFNRSAEKAFAILGSFNAERRTLNLAEIAAAVGMTKSSAQRCTHTLERLGYLRRETRSGRWLLAPRVLGIAHAYFASHPLIENATTHLIDLNQACGESVNLSEPDGADMVFIARFPSHKRFFIHMPIGRRLPMYCTASGRAYLSALPPAEAQRLLRASTLRSLTSQTITDPKQILKLIAAARKLGYAWSEQECYRGDLTIAAAVLGDDGRPVAAINISGPTSRWTLHDLRAKLSPLLLETARAVSGGKLRLRH
jgi:IclR family pca regulon transcriptional regulator